MLTSLTQEQLTERSTKITATDAMKLSGFAPPWMGGAISVFADKTGGGVPVEVNEDIARGIFLESATRDWYAHTTSRAVQQVGTITHKDYPRLAATPDGVSYDPTGMSDKPVELTDFPDAKVLEIKCPRYGHDWDDAPPPYYTIQVTMQMGLTRIHEAELVAIIGGSLRIYTIQWSSELFDSLAYLAEKFWRDHVVKRVPPDPDGSDAYGDWLAKRHPQELRADLIPVSENATRWVEQYRAATSKEKEALAAKQEARNNLVALIGDNTGIANGDGRPLVVYRKCKDSQNIDYRGIVDELNPDAATVARHIKTKPGHRAIKVYA